MQRRHETRNVPTEVLRAFTTILDCGSFTKAATILGLTQSAVSAQIKRLERLLGQDVFVKGTVTLTDRGRSINRLARQALTINDQIIDRNSSSVRVGLPTLYGGNLLRDVFERGKTLALQFDCDSVPNLHQRFEAGHLDVLLELSSNSLPDAEVSWTEQACWVSTPDFVPMQGAPFPFVRWPDSPLDNIAVKALQHASLRYESTVLAHDLSTQIDAVRAGLGYAVFAERAAANEFKVCETLPALPPIYVGIRVRREIGPKAQNAVDCLVKVARGAA